MSDDFGVTPLGQHGGKRPGAGRPRKGEPRPIKQDAVGNLKPKYGSNSSDYITARLMRDANDGVRTAAVLLAGIREGRISTFAAGVEMNYTKRPEPNGRGSQNRTRANDWRMHRVLHPKPRPDPKAMIG